MKNPNLNSYLFIFFLLFSMSLFVPKQASAVVGDDTPPAKERYETKKKKKTGLITRWLIKKLNKKLSKQKSDDNGEKIIRRSMLITALSSIFFPLAIVGFIMACIGFGRANRSGDKKMRRKAILAMLFSFLVMLVGFILFIKYLPISFS